MPTVSFCQLSDYLAGECKLKSKLNRDALFKKDVEPGSY